MWCIGALTQEYRQRMYSLLELCARPMAKTEPIICIDEKSLQLIGHNRVPLPMTAASPTKQDFGDPFGKFSSKTPFWQPTG